MNNWVEERKCEICQTSFIATHPRNVCCSDKCKKEKIRQLKKMYQKGYIRKTKETKREYRKEYTDNRKNLHRKKIYEYFGGQKCMRCGVEHECTSMYEVHHTKPEKKEANIGNMLNGSWEKIEKELEDTILLCSNCHRIIHWEEKKNGNK